MSAMRWMTVVVAGVVVAAAVPADAVAASGSLPPSLARTGNPPKTATVGEAITVRWRAVNRSRRRSSRVAVTVRLKPASGRSRLLSGRAKTPALRARGTHRGKGRFTIPASIAPAEYTLVACLKRRRVKAVCRPAARRLTVQGTSAATPGPAPRLIAAGDIAGCESWSTGDDATAALLDSLGGDAVAPLGDLVYPNGTRWEFDNCYGPNWGRHKPRTRPAIGNHEYYEAPYGAAGYFGYFGAAAGDPSQGYYSYDLGSWHVIALNSNCSKVGCDGASAQAQWLRQDLAANPAACTLAYWHHPRFSSSPETGPTPAMAPLWAILDDAGADVALTGHAHTYERFAPQTATGAASPTGLRQWIVGTGGRSHHTLGSPRAVNSEASHTGTFGVLEMTLRPGGYDWRFVPVAGGTFSDGGSANCV